MSFLQSIRAADSPSIDAFARWRVSNPVTLFDSKQIHDNQPLFWDDSETSGSGTSSSHSTTNACTTISVGATTAGKRVRQTFQRFNYQPGKSQLILMTCSEFETSTGITKEMGYYDGTDGIYLKSAAGTVSVEITSGSSQADQSATQANFNLDTLDGNGPSGITIDWDKTFIFLIDFEWLGVGRVRCALVQDGVPVYFHEFNNANATTHVYMSTPNLPLRYSIENSGTGAADDFDHICSSVQSEGGQEKNGVLRHADSSSVSGLSSGTKYAILGIRLQSGKLDGIVELENLSMISTTTNDQAHWELVFNPTVAGTFTYANETNSVVQTASGSSSNTVTSGTHMDGGYFSTSLPISPTLPNALRLGADIAGTVDEIVLTCTPITNNITVEASLTWRELS